MCGIAGVWHRDGRHGEAALLEDMLDRMVHRGPDDRGSWSEGPLALGHVRLSILDLGRGGHQPYQTPDGQGVLTYNGEVYNYRSLREELEREGVSCRSRCDSEVLLHALHTWGPRQAIPRLNGMFAFAYLDRREGALWLARDRLGIKPLHVAVRGSDLLFASEIKALLAHPDVPARPDLRAVTIALIVQPLQGRWVPFEEIETVEPGTWWRVTRDGIERFRWFHVLQDFQVERLCRSNGEGLAAQADTLEAKLRRSVVLHLASDVPLAASCSGGVDSGLVAACAREEKPDLVAYVADVEGDTGEGDQAERVGRHLRIPVRRIPVRRERWLRTWPLTTWLHEYPNVHFSDGARLALSEACRADGFKVLLTGEGSDELFGGYDSHVKTWKMWRRLQRKRRWSWSERRRWSRRLQHLTEAPLSVSPARGDLALGLRLTVALDTEARLRAQRIFEMLEPVRPLEDRAFLAHGLEDLYSHLGNILRHHDRFSMGAGVESRVPFLENALIDFGLHLPCRAKFHRRTGKWLVKQVAERHLPRGIVHAQKKGFPIPDVYHRGSTGLLRGGALADLLGWSRQAVTDLVPRLEAESLTRYQVVSADLRARIFVRGESPEELGERLVAAAN